MFKLGKPRMYVYIMYMFVFIYCIPTYLSLRTIGEPIHEP